MPKRPMLEESHRPPLTRGESLPAPPVAANYKDAAKHHPVRVWSFDGSSSKPPAGWSSSLRARSPKCCSVVLFGSCALCTPMIFVANVMNLSGIQSPLAVMLVFDTAWKRLRDQMLTSSRS